MRGKEIRVKKMRLEGKSRKRVETFEETKVQSRNQGIKKRGNKRGEEKSEKKQGGRKLDKRENKVGRGKS